jgi:hypothetical protein
VVVSQTVVEEDHDEEVREEVRQVVAENRYHPQVADALEVRQRLRGRKKSLRSTCSTRR